MNRTIRYLLLIALTGAMPVLHAGDSGIQLATGIVNLVSVSVSACSTIVDKCTSKSSKSKENAAEKKQQTQKSKSADSGKKK